MGAPAVHARHSSIQQLFESASTGNAAVIKRLRVCAHSCELFSQTSREAELGRMTPPVPLQDVDLHCVRVSQRFAVEQVRADGSTKVRCVDSCTESGINPCTEPGERIELDGLDFLLEIMRNVLECVWASASPIRGGY